MTLIQSSLAESEHAQQHEQSQIGSTTSDVTDQDLQEDQKITPRPSQDNRTDITQPDLNALMEAVMSFRNSIGVEMDNS